MLFTYSLKKPHEFRRAYSKGKSAACQFFIVYCRPNGRRYSRLGITATTKLGNAVLRNRIRRRIRETYRLNEARLARGFDVVVVARSDAEDGDFAQLGRELIRLSKRLGFAAQQSEGGGNG